MVARLKSISKQIHWSLLTKASVFGLAWFFFPFWLFILIALYLYFVPPSQAGRLGVPFLVLLILTYIEPANLWYAIIFALLFYCLLLIKDLLLIDRKSAFELLVLALSFFLFNSFYSNFGAAGFTAAAMTYALLTALLFGWLIHSFINCFSERRNNEDENGEYRNKVRFHRIAGWLSFVLIWQFLIAGLFLPLNASYQSVIAFIAAILIADLLPEYCLAGLSRQKVLGTATTAFILLALVLASASWRI